MKHKNLQKIRIILLSALLVFSIFKRIEKEEDKQIVVDSYCTRPYVQDVILRYCQNRSIFKTKFAIIDGMLLE